ncbi:MAG: guanine deaminase, partial [Gammaproteobacteria bacterium]|nr:guanine deaminase [Gammaproteobacteria bacterium]
MQAFRASILDFIDDPFVAPGNSHRYVEDGLLVVENGLVTDCGEYAQLKNKLPEGFKISDYSGYLIMPGFIDTHVHYAQTDIIASHGAQLLDWLERYTFPTEKKFSDPAVAQEVADFFIKELLRNGTTSAMVFATIHPQSVDAVFKAALQQKMCLISGKVMMDRNAPDYLCDTAQSSYDDSLALIEKWHHHERLHYAVTPRFAPTSTEQQLKVAQQLINEFPDVYLQSHVAESPGEVEWVEK